MNSTFLMQNLALVEMINYKEKQHKRIRFHNLVNVVLIPSNSDMESIKNEIWWSKVDYVEFYVSAQNELRDFIGQHFPMNRYHAMKLLYQPFMLDE